MASAQEQTAQGFNAPPSPSCGEYVASASEHTPIAVQALLAKASLNAGNKENSVAGRVEQLSSEVAKLQQSHSGLAAILHQSCTQLQRSQGSAEDARRLQLRMDHLAGKVDALAEVGKRPKA